MNENSRRDHRERAAYVYVRQSSLHHHGAGQQRQYELADGTRGGTRVRASAGAVFDLEASCRARGDWHHLINRCGMNGQRTLAFARHEL